MNPIIVLGWLMLVVAGFALGHVIIKPQVGQPPQLLIGRVLMPVSMMLFGVCMVIQPITAQTFVLPAVAGILSVVAFVLHIRYRTA